jgi:hypothetical protein
MVGSGLLLSGYAIEQRQFGKDGYEEAVKQIGDIEGSLGLTDLTQFTAPPPPQS